MTKSTINPDLPQGFKPMLAVAAELDQVKFPVLASPKLDGIRAVIFNGVAYSRSLKPIPNKHIQEWCNTNADDLEGFDGEFIVGSPTAEDVFNKTTSFVMSHDKVGEFNFYVFDIVSVYPPGVPASLRTELLHPSYQPDDIFNKGICKSVTQTYINNLEELQAYEAQQLELGYEGTMLKSPDGYYKFGRSTLKSQQLLKRKLFVDDEFEIIGYEPKYHNANEATTNELGRTERSSHKENLIALDTLGALICKTKEGKEFGVGTGFDDQLRSVLWTVKDSLIGQLAKVKYFPVGMEYGVPRFPVFLGLRSKLDTSE